MHQWADLLDSPLVGCWDSQKVVRLASPTEISRGTKLVVPKVVLSVDSLVDSQVVLMVVLTVAKLNLLVPQMEVKSVIEVK